MTIAETITHETFNCPFSGESRVYYSAVLPTGFIMGSMLPEVWAVWEAAGFPRDETDAGLVWEGGEYGEWTLPAAPTC